jgi:hypothetical protein
MRFVKIDVASEFGKTAKKGWDTSEMTSFSQRETEGATREQSEMNGVRDSLVGS